MFYIIDSERNSDMRGLFILLVLHSMWLRRAIEGNSIGKSEDADFSASGNLLILVTLCVGNTLAGTTTVNSQHVNNLFAVVNAAGLRAEICNAFQQYSKPKQRPPLAQSNTPQKSGEKARASLRWWCFHPCITRFISRTVYMLLSRKLSLHTCVCVCDQ